MKRVMLDEPGLVKAPGIHDQTRTAQVTQVTVGILARVVLDSDVGEQRVGGTLISRDHVFAQHPIARQIVDDQGRRCLLLGIAQDVRQPGVQDPETIAAIGTHAEGRHEFRYAGCAVLMCLPGWIRDQEWRFARV